MSEWLNISTDSGTGNAIITLTAATLTELEARIEHLKVSTITKSRIVEVKQLPRNAVTISLIPSFIAYEAKAANQYTITVTCDGDWVLTLPEWLHTDVVSGSGNGSFVVTADPNRGDSRQGEIRATTRDTYAICIATQDAYSPWLILSENEMSFTASANTADLVVDSSSRWNAALVEDGYGKNAEEEFLARYTIINMTVGEEDSYRFFGDYVDGCVSVIVDGLLYSPDRYGWVYFPTLSVGEHTIWVYSTGNSFNSYALHDFTYDPNSSTSRARDNSCSIKFADNITNVTHYTSTLTSVKSPYIYTSITFSDKTTSIDITGSRVSGVLNIPSGVTFLAANKISGLSSVVFDEKTTGMGALYLRETPISNIEIPLSVSVISHDTFESNNNLTGLTLPLSFKSFGETNHPVPDIPTLSSITSYSLEMDATQTLNFASAGVLTCREGANLHNLPNRLPSGWTINKTLLNPYTIRATYRIEDNSSATTIIHSTSGFSMMRVNGGVWEEPATTYTFSTTGLNEVLFTLSNPALTESMFSGVTSLVSLEIGDGPTDITEIPIGFCKGCTGLSAFTITVQNGFSVGDEAFMSCESLSSLIWLPEKINRIGKNAFSDCHSLTNVLLFDVSTIGPAAFRSCSGLTQAVLPNAQFERIGTSYGYTFANCSALTNVMIMDGVVKIPPRCFMDASLSSITIPSSCTELEQYCFQDCSNLSSITSKAITAPSANTYSFSGIATQGTLYYPQGADYTDFIAALNKNGRNWTVVEITI